jgi:putative sigma-54 modulation protein
VDLHIKTHNMKLTDNLRAYIEEKTSRLDRLNERPLDAKFELRSVKERSAGEVYIAQFTIVAPGNVLRSEERNHDQHRAIDAAVDKMMNQIRRFHDRKIRRSRRDTAGLGVVAADQALTEVEAQLELDGSDGALNIVRVKRFALKPMTAEEAVEQLELLGHNFFVFASSESGSTSVVYRRNDGAYGLIEPELG